MQYWQIKLLGLPWERPSFKFSRFFLLAQITLLLVQRVSKQDLGVQRTSAEHRATCPVKQSHLSSEDKT